MSPKGATRNTAGTGTTKKRDRREDRNTGSESKAQRGAALEFVRTAGPTAIAQMLARLEARGEIVADDDVSADERDYDLDRAADIELDLQDEDLAPVEVWQPPGNLVGNAVELGAEADPPEPCSDGDRFELIVAEGICRFQNPEWAWTFNSVTQRAEHQLAEIAARCRVFSVLAEWLNRARPGFLVSRDFWDLGPVTLDEVAKGCSALQKDLLGMLELNQPVEEESFSRYINQCELVWPDGSVPVQILFSKQARLAWVACAVVVFAQKYPGRPLEERLNEFRTTKVKRGTLNSVCLADATSGSMIFEDFIRAVNQRAKTGWDAVLEKYESRMLTGRLYGKTH